MWSYDGLNWKENNVHESPSLAATAQIGFMEMTDTPGSPNSVPYYYNAIRISNFGNFVEGGSPGSLAFSDMKKADIKREDLSIGDGFSGEIPGGWTIDASGSDKIFDEFGDANHFVYEEIDGDFDRRVQIRRLVPQGADDRAGLMVRGGLESIAQVLKIAVSGLTGEEDETGVPIGRNRVEVMVRQDGTQLEDILNAPAGYSAISRSLPNPAAAMPDLWLRISRSGNHFRMYLSNDGSTWNQIGERYFMGMPGKVFVGTYAAATTVDAGVVTADFTSYGPTNIADGSAPAVVSAGSLDKKIVGVLFSEPLASATVIPANFTVSGATVAGARLGLGGESVYLDVTGDLPNNFTVTINNVTDMAGNAIAANSQVSGSVTTGWTATDLGVFNDPENRPDPIDDPLFIGQTVAVSSGENLTLDIVGGGSNIWNPGDFGHIIYREHEGDFDMHVKVERFDNSYKTSTFGHAGLWIRNSLYLDDQENTADGTKVVNYGNLTYAEANVDRAALAIWRDEVGAGYGNGDVIGAGTADVNGVVGRWGHLRLADATGAFVPGSSPTASRWLRLMREGNTLTSMWSYDGVNWTQHNVHESPNLASTAIVGFMEMTDTAGSPNSNPNFYNAIRISNFSGNFGGSTGGDAEITSVALENGSIVIAFTGKLQSALSPTGPWTDVAATGTYSEPVADGAKFFRVIP
ncbi:MAG: hypothetical protein LR011_12485 [Verrucomicrobia bacterium]|nr:hypothetical protein [Verrucomicrobiota bacterium]